jgi:hypothetical protein
MELPGELYLFNLSLLAISFSVVSALVTLLRQTMGGKLSNFDVYLVSTYVAHGFVLAIAAILASLVAQFGLPLPLVWTIASVFAAVLIGAKEASTLWQYKSFIKARMPLIVRFFFGMHWFAVLLLLANVIPAVQGIALFELALTLCLGVIMWSFIRRISSLLSDQASQDWEPKRG